MARQVARVLEAGGVALVEAGTGTGKSLAYLLPLARRLIQGDPAARAVVATYTIHLQEQLTARDLPVVERALGRPLPAAVAKGWGNYLCRLRLHRLQQGQAGWLEEPGPGELVEGAVRLLSEWAEQAQEGSLSEAPQGVTPEIWSLVAAHPDACARRRCPFYDDCFYFQARQRMLQARLVVANHHLLMSDLVVRREAGGAEAAVLPPFQYLVVDEAHHLDEVAVEHLGLTLSRTGLVARLQRLARGRASRALGEAAGGALEAVQGLFDAVASAVDGAAAADPSGPVRAVSLRADAAGPPVDGDRVEAAAGSLEGLAAAAFRLAEALQPDAPDGGGDEPVDPRALELRAVARWAQRAAEALRVLLAADDDGFVYWAEVGPRQEVVLRAAPLDVGPVLAGELLGQVRSAVLTSATLTCDGRFDALRRRLGLPPPASADEGGDPPGLGSEEGLELWPEEDGVWRGTVGAAGEPWVTRDDGRVLECVIPSLFDYRRQALLAVPSDLPDVDTPAFPRRLADLVAGLAEQLGGRTFCLFTSHRALAETRRALEPRLEERNLRLLCQGDMPRTRLLETFREAGGRGWVLLGTDSFWEGVDVPGPALSCVVLARLPFPVPDHPLVAARAERLRRQGLNPFAHDAVPRAVVKFRQGFGRLVRSQQDRGAVVVADRRLLTRRYRASFLGALPRCQLLVAPAERLIREVAGWAATPSPSS